MFYSTLRECDFPIANLTNAWKKKPNTHSCSSLKCWEFIRPWYSGMCVSAPPLFSFFSSNKFLPRITTHGLRPSDWTSCFYKAATLCLTESALSEAFFCRQTSEEIFIKMDNLWALTLKREWHKVGSKTKAIEKSDEMLDMEPWEHQAENIWDPNLNIYGINSTEGRLSTIVWEMHDCHWPNHWHVERNMVIDY